MKEANSLSDIVHLIAMEELPWELDCFVKTPVKSRFDVLEDEPNLIETYSSLREIVCSIIPDGI